MKSVLNYEITKRMDDQSMHVWKKEGAYDHRARSTTRFTVFTVVSPQMKLFSVE